MKGQNLIGKKAVFKYPDYGTPDGFPQHTAHSGQTVTIINVLPTEDQENAGRLFEVEARDGWVGDVWRDELTVT